VTQSIGARRTQRRRTQRVAQSLSRGRRRSVPGSFERLRARAVRDGDCLLAPGRVDRYSKAWVDGRCVGGHRLAYEAAFGAIPNGLWILHRCVGRKACIEPKHIYPGDALRNNRDTLEAGRARKLRPADVLAIRSGPRTPQARRELADAFDISTSHVWSIQSGRAWSWMPQ
jgi:hypothetical protein